MANTTIATNAEGIAGKWVPYYYKPYNLGSTDTAAPDGTTYIEAEVGDAEIYGECTSSYNCGYYYKLYCSAVGGSRFFFIKKYNEADDSLVDTIYASGVSGNARYWGPIYTDYVYTIDVGVVINFNRQTGSGHNTDIDNSDIYEIRLPSKEIMERQRMYHGGYSTFLRNANVADTNTYTEVIPSNLKGKNISLAVGGPFSNRASYLGEKGLVLMNSYEGPDAGNHGQSLFIEWNFDIYGATSALYPNATSWQSGETWQLGTQLFADLNYNRTLALDSPGYTSISAEDVTGITTHTGGIASHNITVSGRAGHARLKIGFLDDGGTECICAANQFIPIILMIS